MFDARADEREAASAEVGLSAAAPTTNTRETENGGGGRLESEGAAAARQAATTISTIAVHTRDSRIVLAVMQVPSRPVRAGWARIELRCVRSVRLLISARVAQRRVYSAVQCSKVQCSCVRVRAGGRLGARAARASRAEPLRDGREST